MADSSASFPARIWLRVDALEPLTCSVRFSLHEGEGHLDWGQGAPGGLRASSRSGAAGGLSIADLPRLELVYADTAHGLTRRVPVPLTALPARARAQPGQWIEVDTSDAPDAESTDLVFAIDILDTGYSAMEPDVAELEDTTGALDASPVGVMVTGDIDEPDELDTDLTASPPMPPPEKPSGPGASGSALVRSLVQRIRQQEEEIKSLKQQIAVLEARSRL